MDMLKRTFALRNHLMMLNRATSDKQEPTAGYLYDEIVRLTFESDEVSNDLLGYLLSRLKKKSPHTKLKCVKILRICVERAHEGFVRDLQSKADEIKAAAEFKGTIDQYHGDHFNSQVRKEAKVLLDELFNVSDLEGRQAPVASSISKDGFGSSQSITNTAYRPKPVPSQQSSAASSSMDPDGYHYTESTSESGLKLWGIGNTPMESDKPSFVDRMKSKMGQVKDKVVNAFTDEDDPDKHHYSQPPTAAQQDMEQSFSKLGGYKAPGEEYSAPSSPTRFTGSSTAETTTITKDSEYIPRLVATITAPGGVKVAPPKQDLDRFVERCHTLDGHQVAESLLDRMDQADTDKQLLRTLHVVRALAASDIIGIDKCLSTMRESLEECAQEDHVGVRKKAAEILRILDAARDGAAVATTTQTVAQAAPQTETNLLDFDLDGPSAPPADSTSSMFSGMMLPGQQSGSTSTPSTAPPTSLFSGMTFMEGGTQAQTQAQPAQPAQGSSMFSGMNMMGTDTSASTSTATQQSAMASSDTSLLGLDFGTSSVSAPAPVQPVAAASDPLDPLASLFGSTAPAQPQPLQTSQPATTTSVDLTSFLQASSATQPQQQQQFQQGGMTMGMNAGMGMQPMAMNQGMMMGMQPMMMNQGMMMGMQQQQQRPMHQAMQPMAMQPTVSSSFTSSSASKPATKPDAFAFVSEAVNKAKH
eukprot:m.357391 g.357391  ORF g.357391 m.357391 type:complete len:700 (-) comp17812_c0_seq1:198-2297(-)